jgi:hypothetical protein
MANEPDLHISRVASHDIPGQFADTLTGGLDPGDGVRTIRERRVTTMF